MSLTIKLEKGLIRPPIKSTSTRGTCYIGEDFIPQQIRDCPLQAVIDIFEKSHHYIVSARVPGVELINLWVFIEGKALSLYATVTGEKQESGEYRYSEKILGGIRGEATLPMKVCRHPERAELDDGVLFLVFQKEIDELLEQTTLI